jgi:hypothetical protein
LRQCNGTFEKCATRREVAGKASKKPVLALLLPRGGTAHAERWRLPFVGDGP